MTGLTVCSQKGLPDSPRTRSGICRNDGSVPAGARRIGPEKPPPAGFRPGTGPLHGFTLIELIVVIALLSIMLAISLPRFHNVLLADSAGKTSRWLIGTTQGLRESALRQQQRYTLHIDLDTGTLWTSNASMNEEAILEAAATGYRLPDGMRLRDVEYPRSGRVGTGRADITFYPQGYSDQALIHLDGPDDASRTYAIEPFLSAIEIYETDKSYRE